jgi:hypothetical protein
MSNEWIESIPISVNTVRPDDSIGCEEHDFRLMCLARKLGGIGIGEDDAIETESLEYALDRMVQLEQRAIVELPYATPASVERIVNHLASGLGLKKPPVDQMQNYKDSLSTIREYKLKLVAQHLRDSHVYHNLPKPAEFHKLKHQLSTKHDMFLSLIKFAVHSYSVALRYRKKEEDNG